MSTTLPQNQKQGRDVEDKRKMFNTEDHTCEYCGASPAFEVVWTTHVGESVVESYSVYLCERCDDLEIAELERDAEDD